MVAVRHLCDGNMENQNVISRLEKVGGDGGNNTSGTAARLAALKAAGIKASVGSDGKMTLRRVETLNTIRSLLV